MTPLFTDVGFALGFAAGALACGLLMRAADRWIARRRKK